MRSEESPAARFLECAEFFFHVLEIGASPVELFLQIRPARSYVGMLVLSRLVIRILGDAQPALEIGDGLAELVYPLLDVLAARGDRSCWQGSR